MADQPLTVTALTKYIKYKFDHDTHLQSVFLEGEISNFKHNARGHFYFTLKDDQASISAVMFASKAQTVGFKPQEGMSVVLRGNISVFEAYGSYQIYVDQMQEKGLGQLYQDYLKLKEALLKAGYFDPAKKKPLPPYPKQIAIITSSTGAVIRDMITTLNSRFPLVKVLLYPTVVQGTNAAPSIVENIQKADSNPDNDIIIVGRGGGSIEDLWAFNERSVAEAIYRAHTPIISAVGHETDYTISDEVADFRAPTPTAAAQLAVPDQNVIRADLYEQRRRLSERLKRSSHEAQQRIVYLKQRTWYAQPERLLMPFERRIEFLVAKLKDNSPRYQWLQTSERVAQLKQTLSQRGCDSIVSKKQKLSLLKQALIYQNPLTILSQGYALVEKDHRVITSVVDVRPAETLIVRLKDGRIHSRVDTIEKKENNS